MLKELNELGLSNFDYRPLPTKINVRSRRGTTTSKRPYYNDLITGRDKDIFFLHHAVSSGDPYSLHSFFSRQNFSTTYAIGGYGMYDGLILQLFESIYNWGYHINMRQDIQRYGRSNTKLNKAHEVKFAKRTISAEICNYGALKEYKMELFHAYSFKPESQGGGLKNNVQPIPKDQIVDYVKIYGKEFRGSRYYHRYTDKQIASIKELIYKLAKKMYWKLNHLPKDNMDLSWCDLKWEGVMQNLNPMTHTNVRIGKSDVHPQPELLGALAELRDTDVMAEIEG